MMDETRFRALYQEMYSRLWSYVYRMVTDRAECDDTVQEAFFHFLRSAPAKLTDTYLLLMIEIADSIKAEQLDEKKLSAAWRTMETETRLAGDVWLESMSTALLSVPSAIVPHTRNYLINPLHPEARKIKIRSYGHYPFDSRLFK